MGSPVLAILAAILCVMTWGICISQTGQDGLWAIGWVFFVAFASVVAALRYQVRQLHNIGGNCVEDFFACLILWFLVIPQLESVQDEPLPSDEMSKVDST